MSLDPSADAAPLGLSNTADGEDRSPPRIGTDMMAAVRAVNQHHVQRIAQQHARIERLDNDAARRHEG